MFVAQIKEAFLVHGYREDVGANIMLTYVGKNELEKLVDASGYIPDRQKELLKSGKVPVYGLIDGAHRTAVMNQLYREDKPNIGQGCLKATIMIRKPIQEMLEVAMTANSVGDARHNVSAPGKMKYVIIYVQHY